MIRNPVHLTLALLAVLGLVALPAASNLEAQGSKGTIKIATQSPLSGGQAALGEGIKLGTQLAVEKFKGNLEKMGYKVELVPFDDQAKPDVGVANAKNIIADKDILVVIGHLNSGVAIPSSEVYKEVNLAMISPANTNPTITDRGYASVYRVCGRDDVQGVVGSEFAHATLKAKTAFVIHDKTTYGQGVAEFFKADAEKKGIKVLGFEGTEEKDRKSTRLNSSHDQISYAVFCLKKKKTRNTQTHIPNADLCSKNIRTLANTSSRLHPASRTSAIHTTATTV